MTDARLVHYAFGHYDIDIDPVTRDAVLIGGDEDTYQEAVLQDVLFTLSTFFGESTFNRSLGFPWVESVFGVQPIEGVGALLQDHVTARPGVQGLNAAPVITFEPEAGRLFVTLDIQGKSFNEVVTIGVRDVS